MKTSKPAYQSVTIWGAFIAGVATVAQITLNVTVTLEAQSIITNGIIATIQLGGSIAALYGRFKATKQIV